MGKLDESADRPSTWSNRNRVGELVLAQSRRIKATHRRRCKIASGRFVQRYYYPALGRFLSVDPVTADGNTGSSFNRYWYANNNPYTFTDPDGRVGANFMFQGLQDVVQARGAYQMCKSRAATPGSAITAIQNITGSPTGGCVEEIRST